MKRFFILVMIMFLLGYAQAEKESKPMKLSDYLEKMARGDKLNSLEVQHMKTLADEMDEKVAMWSKDGPNTLTVRSLRAQDAFFTNMPTAYMVMDRRDYAIPHNSWTSVSDYLEYTPVSGDRVSNTNDFFELDVTNGRIYLNQPNRMYAFYVFTTWVNNVDGYRAARVAQFNAEDDSQIAVSDVYRIPAVGGTGRTTFTAFIFVPWGGDRQPGDYAVLQLYQNSGVEIEAQYVAFGAFVIR